MIPVSNLVANCLRGHASVLQRSIEPSFLEITSPAGKHRPFQSGHGT